MKILRWCASTGSTTSCKLLISRQNSCAEGQPTSICGDICRNAVGSDDDDDDGGGGGLGFGAAAAVGDSDTTTTATTPSITTCVGHNANCGNLTNRRLVC